jgi:hypothetical protein
MDVLPRRRIHLLTDYPRVGVEAMNASTDSRV